LDSDGRSTAAAPLRPWFSPNVAKISIPAKVRYFIYTASIVFWVDFRGQEKRLLFRSLLALASDQQFTSVGYGAYEVTNDPGGHQYLYNDVRMVATGTLNSINPSWLRISMNPATGNGGTCYGDSGGPNFLGTTNIVAATTITGDAICRSTNVTYRLDTQSARAFLGQFVTLP